MEKREVPAGDEPQRSIEAKAMRMARRGMRPRDLNQAEVADLHEGRASHRVEVRVRIPGLFRGTLQKSNAKGPIILRSKHLLQPLGPDPLRKGRDGSLGDLGL